MEHAARWSGRRLNHLVFIGVVEHGGVLGKADFGGRFCFALWNLAKLPGMPSAQLLLAHLVEEDLFLQMWKEWGGFGRHRSKELTWN